MGSAGGDPQFPLEVFEDALRRAEADANALRAAGRAEASRRLAAADTERREVLTAAMYRVSLVLREAEARAAEIEHEALEHRRHALRDAMEERERLREEAMRDAQQIRNDAAEDAAKLLVKLTTERDHILADAREDARRIIDAAHDPVWTDIPNEPLTVPVVEPGPESDPVATSHHADVWPINLDSLFDDADVDVAGESTGAPPVRSGAWKDRRRRWYQRSR